MILYDMNATAPPSGERLWNKCFYVMRTSRAACSRCHL